MFGLAGLFLCATKTIYVSGIHIISVSLSNRIMDIERYHLARSCCDKGTASQRARSETWQCDTTSLPAFSNTTLRLRMSAARRARGPRVQYDQQKSRHVSPCAIGACSLPTVFMSRKGGREADLATGALRRLKVHARRAGILARRRQRRPRNDE